jgi:hypothetical protein
MFPFGTLPRGGLGEASSLSPFLLFANLIPEFDVCDPRGSGYYSNPWSGDHLVNPRTSSNRTCIESAQLRYRLTEVVL